MSQDAFLSPKILVEHLLTKHGEVRVPRSRGRTASQTGPGSGDHSSPDPMVLSQPSRDDGPSTQQLDPATAVPMETSQPQDNQEPIPSEPHNDQEAILMETSQSGSQTT